MQRERWKIIAPTHVLPNGHGVFKPFTISDPVSRNHFNVNMYVFPAYPTPLAAQARITHRCLSLLHQQISSFSFWVTQQSHFRFGHFSRRGGLWTPRLHKDWGQFKEFDWKSSMSSFFRLGLFGKVQPMLCRSNSNFPTTFAEIKIGFYYYGGGIIIIVFILYRIIFPSGKWE